MTNPAFMQLQSSQGIYNIQASLFAWQSATCCDPTAHICAVRSQQLQFAYVKMTFFFHDSACPIDQMLCKTNLMSCFAN